MSFDEDSKANGMPGKKITDHQVNKYKEHRYYMSQVAAAAKSAISERSARRIEHSDALPSQRPRREWCALQDPLAAAWDVELAPLLRSDAQLFGGYEKPQLVAEE